MLQEPAENADWKAQDLAMIDPTRAHGASAVHGGHTSKKSGKASRGQQAGHGSDQVSLNGQNQPIKEADLKSMLLQARDRVIGGEREAHRVEGKAVSAGGFQASLAYGVKLREGRRADREIREPIYDLKVLSDRAMEEKGLRIDFNPKEMKELSAIKTPAKPAPGVVDLRQLKWCSIDNDDSKDLDQLNYAERMPDGRVKVYVAIADVDSLVPKGSAIDKRAANNTTSVYTADKIYPMLPRPLSEDMTSLNPHEDRLAMVTEYIVNPDGSLEDGKIYPAYVHNHAKLAYNGVAAWLENKGPMPGPMGEVEGLPDLIKMQSETAQAMRTTRHESGSLTLESLETKAQMADGKVEGIKREKQNIAQQLIEEFMVGANGIAAKKLEEKGFPRIMRVVKTPEKWDRIVAVAAERGYRLPREASSKELEKFLMQERAADPDRFPDLSLEIVKLLGRGEYVMVQPGEEPPGHFGLAVKDYSHSTAPNRRYPDLITQRMLKAAVANRPNPYTEKELEGLALQCSTREADSKKVERQVSKSAAALHLMDHIGEQFEGFVTGAGPKGTWVRIVDPPVEGKLSEGADGVQRGDKLTVELLSVNVEKGFIDFGRVQ